MSSSRNVPEWFGGGGGGSKSAANGNTHRSRSSSNGSRRSSARKPTDGTSTSLGSSKSDRRKRSSHKRRSSRDAINHSEFFNKIPQEQNYSMCLAPIEDRQSRDTSGRRNGSKGDEDKLTSAGKPTSSDGDNNLEIITKKPSFVDRLLGITTSRHSPPQKTDNTGTKKSRARPNDDISVMNTSGSQKNNIGSSKDNRDPAALPSTHRRAHSDSVDLSQYSISMSPNISSSRDSAHQTTDIPQVTSTHAQSVQAAPKYLVEVKDAVENTYSRNGSAAMDYSSVESDDQLVYSEDESTTQPRSIYPVQMRQMQNLLNPYQQSFSHQNHESQQILEHQRMMRLAPPRQLSSFTRPAAHPHYGTTHPVTDDTRPRITSPVNEFYISEDETLMSETSRSRRMWQNYYQEQRGFKGSQNDIDNAIPEEEEDFTESTALLTESTSLLSSVPSTKSILNSSNSVKSNNSNGSNGGGKNVTIVPPLSLSLTSGTSSHSGSDKSKKMQHPAPNRTSPPPPIQSFSFQPTFHTRAISTGTETTASASMYSPHNGLLVKNLAMQQPRAHTRKEQKRLLRKVEDMEEKENRIQSIIRSGHGDALDWSQHVSQHVRGLNLAAGFFPHEDSKTHDVPFALIFLAQLCFVIYLAIHFAGDTVLTPSTFYESSLQESQSIVASGYNDDPFSTEPSYSTSTGSAMSKWAKDVHVDYANALKLACITALYATSLSALFIGMMMILGKALIPTTLCLSIILCIAFATIGIALSPYSFIPIIGIIVLALSVGYSIVVWDRIPFAATNLDTALCGVKCTADVLIVGWIMTIAAFLWTIAWTAAFLGIYDNYLDHVFESATSSSVTYNGAFICVAMISSYLWTINVFMVSYRYFEVLKFVGNDLNSHNCFLASEYNTCNGSRRSCHMVVGT